MYFGSVLLSLLVFFKYKTITIFSTIDRLLDGYLSKAFLVHIGRFWNQISLSGITFLQNSLSGMPFCKVRESLILKIFFGRCGGHQPHPHPTPTPIPHFARNRVLK